MSRNPAWQPFATGLLTDLSSIATAFEEVVKSSTIKRTNWNDPYDSVVVIAPELGWGHDSPENLRRRHDVLARYEMWHERFQTLFRSRISELTEAQKDPDRLIRDWLARDSMDWGVPSTIEEAVAKGQAAFGALSELIRQFVPESDALPLVVPDTNVLLRQPDLAKLITSVGAKEVEVVLLPTVLSELDELKDRGRTEDVRKAAQAAVRRIKGLRDKGPLSAGVNLTRQITVRAMPRDPDMDLAPNWLKASNRDDRILAAALELQASSPSRPVVMVSADINLQNKAEFAGLPFADPAP